MSLRSERKKQERENKKRKRREKTKQTFQDRLEEWKLNRQGKTKRKRSEVMSRYRQVDRRLNLWIGIVGLLFIIVWVIILFI